MLNCPVDRAAGSFHGPVSDTPGGCLQFSYPWGRLVALRFSGMRAIVAFAAMVLVLTACSGSTNTPTSKSESVAKASPTAMTTSATATSTLVPGGWGKTPEPPRHGSNGAVGAGSVSDVKAAFDETSNAIDRFDSLQRSPDVNTAKAGVQDMAEPVDIKLAPHVPTRTLI